MRPRTLLPVLTLTAACGGASLTPADVAESPGGALAVTFSRTFAPGFWEPGDHAYRLVVTCPTQSVGPPVVRFEVSSEAPRVGTVWLRFDGPGRSVLAPADLSAVHPDDTTVAAVTLAGMTEAEADQARSACEGTVIWDGLDPQPLEPGPVFSP